MATKNFSYILISFILLTTVSCANLRTRSDLKSENTNTAPPTTGEAPTPNIPPALVPTPVAPSIQPGLGTPKIGLILGPGSARAYAHVGVVQELAKAKLPITHAIGFEMGSVVAAIYASKGLPFDVEWQMFKLKDLKSLGTFLSTVFTNQKVEDFKLHFACPAYNLVKQQTFMMNRGVVTQMLPYCLSAPPLLKPYLRNVSALTELKLAVDYLKSKGITYIVYVNILGSKNGVLTDSLESESNIFWSLISQAISRQQSGVDFVVNVPVQDFDLSDYGKRREILQKGLEAGQEAAAQIAKKLGL